jgi:hypothetical protein
MPDFEPVVIDHPVSSITQEEISARIRQIRQAAEKMWIGGQIRDNLEHETERRGATLE